MTGVRMYRQAYFLSKCKSKGRGKIGLRDEAKGVFDDGHWYTLLMMDTGIMPLRPFYFLERLHCY